MFVSGLMLPSSVPGRILAAAIAGDFEIVLCEAMLEEISVALHYPKVRKRISLSNDELDRYVQALRFTADVVDPAGIDVQVPDDRDDHVILATLMVAKADWLVTGDAALLALRDRYPIVAPSEFAARYLG
jgi:putative PIN family toxin of toxin-antitoxin system